jgi:cytochrome c oxidase subunit I
MAAAAVIAGKASVLYTFYAPLLASAWYYGGVFLLIGGSMIWVVLMIVNMAAWKRDQPGKPVPLAMFAITATALLWAWTASGVFVELVGILLPRAFGWTTLIDAGLGRRLFSVTLHGIVYFWLLPAYIAFYTLLRQAAGGRLYSDTMGRLTFIMLLIFSLPVGMHHLLADPEHGVGFKFLQSFLTFFVVLPTLLTVYSICASLEIAGRHRGSRGLLGWIGALPWGEPMVLATALSLVMLGDGGFGGIINMSYAMNSMVHNTSWVTAHFHLIFGGAVVIMYFAIAYEMWPRITGKPLRSKKLARHQLWLWFLGMMLVTIPWHIAGLMGQPRRVAVFDYNDPLVARMGPLVIISVIGGLILLLSAVLLIFILIRSHFGERTVQIPLRYALAVNPPAHVPSSFNGFALWTILLVLMLVAYGYPIGQFALLKPHSVPAYEVSSHPDVGGGR